MKCNFQWSSRALSRRYRINQILAPGEPLRFCMLRFSFIVLYWSYECTATPFSDWPIKVYLPCISLIINLWGQALSSMDGSALQRLKVDGLAPMTALTELAPRILKGSSHLETFNHGASKTSQPSEVPLVYTGCHLALPCRRGFLQPVDRIELRQLQTSRPNVLCKTAWSGFQAPCSYQSRLCCARNQIRLYLRLAQQARNQQSSNKSWHQGVYFLVWGLCVQPHVNDSSPILWATTWNNTLLSPLPTRQCALKCPTVVLLQRVRKQYSWPPFPCHFSSCMFPNRSLSVQWHFHASSFP